MMLCAHFLLPRLQQKVWSLYMSCSMMSTGARSPVWVDRESQFAADTEEESQGAEAMFQGVIKGSNMLLVSTPWQRACTTTTMAGEAPHWRQRRARAT
jgi:hypothetical protein